MVKIQITENDAGQRLDRFLKKFLKRAPLSAIYRIIRKDLKVNGKRSREDTILSEGDELTIYMSEEQLQEMTRQNKKQKARRQFRIAYEDSDVLIVEKPWGLLTHGDSSEKKNTLMNQVCGYLQQKGEYDPARERTFTPSPVNRLDRNTTGLVIFGKNAASLRVLTRLLRDHEAISKYYITIVAGDFDRELLIDEALSKDETTNTVRISEEGRRAVSIARPLERSKNYSVVEVELITGRTHQIRAHMASAGFPLIGDSKYGRSRKGIKANARARELGVTTQLLHAYRLQFGEIPELKELSGLEVTAKVPDEFERVWRIIKKD
ncbi:MAG: RluA family pseudouridine synthase [Bacillota bacterium]|nr:RluA family pseudouridine synthase [Bacillota bacterium]